MAVTALRSPPAPESPQALWRDGVVVEIRGCDVAPGHADAVRCAGLHCAQRVTRALSDANQAKLTIERAIRAPDGTFEVRGTIVHFLKSLSQPTRFRCTARRPSSPDLELFTPQSEGPAP